MKWQKIFANHISNKGFKFNSVKKNSIVKKNKELEFKSKKKNNCKVQFKAKDLNTISQKKPYR